MPARRKKRWKTILPTATLTAIPFFVNASPVMAFFPPVVPPPPIVVPPVLPPVLPPVIVIPPVCPPPFVPPEPPVIPPVVVPPCHCHTPTPNCVPEPATIMTGLFGLVSIAGYGVFRRKKEGTGDDAIERVD